MYTYIMNTDKSLIRTSESTIYQRENLVDKIQFLFPETYENTILSNCSAILKYIDQGNEAHSEILNLDTEPYSYNSVNYLRYSINVDTQITRFAGTIVFRISFLNIESEEEVLHTGEGSINIKPLNDLFAFAPRESLEVIDKEYLKIQAMNKALSILADSIDQNKADDIELSSENGELYLTSNNKKIGTGLSLNNLGNALSDNTKDGLTFMITDEEEISDDKPQYSLSIDSNTNELLLLSNGVVISRVSAQDLGELIVKSTKDDGLNEVLT